MKKLYAIVLGGILALALAGCEQPGYAVTPLAPPSWIMGVWKDSTLAVTFTFTSDDATMTSSFGSVDYKLTDSHSNGSNDVYDSSSSSSYLIMLKSNGNVIQTIEFDKLTATTMNWTVTTGATIDGPVVLNKQ